MARGLLFVYGSMKKDFRNHYRLHDSVYIGRALTKNNYNIHPAKNFLFPYAVEYENRWQLEGELYKLTSADIEKIDVIEGTPNYYYRKNIDVIYDEKVYQAFIYFKSSSNENCMNSQISLFNWSQKLEIMGIKNYKI